MVAMKNIAVARYEAFGSAGMAEKIKTLNLESMTQLYTDGLLSPKVT